MSSPSVAPMRYFWRDIAIVRPGPDEQPTQTVPIFVGVYRLDAEGTVLEFRPDGCDQEEIKAFSGLDFFSIAPWTKDPSFTTLFKASIHSALSNFHFDFKVAFRTMERHIHVNIMGLGDRTAWLFVSDKTLPQL